MTHKKFFPLAAFAAMLAVSAVGCAELHQHALGTRVHNVTVKGRDYVHCSILTDPTQPELARDALKVCEDAIHQQPQQQQRNANK